MDLHYLPSIVPATAPILVGLLFLFHLLWKQRFSRRTPPEAGGAWPIIGHLHLLAGPQPPHITLAHMADKYGPIFTIKMGVHRALVVSSWEMAKECLTTNDKIFANRPKAAAPEHMTYNYAMFGFSPYGPYWRQVRKIATLELLSNHRLEMLSHVRVSEVNTAIKEKYELWVKNNNSGNNNNGVGVEMKKWFGDITLNVIFRMVVGKRYLEATSLSEIGSDDRCRKALRDFFELTGTFVVSDALPYLKWLDFGGYEKSMKKTSKELDQLAQRWLEEHKRKRVSGEVNGDQDFMDVMLSILDGAELGISSTYDADTINKATSLALILAGTDTTTVTMTWALALLLNNREALKKAEQELDLYVGKERQVKESDLKNLVYLQAILKETMRLYPAGPLSLPHESTEDCTVGGYHVPAGTRLLLNLSKLHLDPKVWDQPSEFRPERFLTAHKNVDVRGQNFELIPFSSGRRMCPGVSFALQVMQLTLAALLHGFKIATRSDEPVDMRETVGLTNLKATPLDVIITPRLHAGAYQ
ncbi:Cytochrome P450 82A3 [Morus notabilis]|uniref:Cytochrome P450 82A3 n=1 Tax=Morus notabilis TaxID=981085 RepID=W9S3S6_9ROSA|nr:cytochrome P450 CYP82D47 [Morus notabilis]EXC07349.1 Cytochrome P450 82A3 [Morus notabilis]